MVSSVNNSNALHHTNSQKSLKMLAANSEETGESKMHTPPGQAAKDAILLSDRTDLPANIQGKVASALARGIPIDGLLGLQEAVSPDDVVETPVDETEVIDSELAEEPAGETDPSIASQDEPLSIATVPEDNDATIAATLLEAAIPDEDGTTE